MDRREEYALLRQELEQTPPELEQAVVRAMRRYRRERCQRMITSVAGLACVMVIAFVMLVNTFPSFAYACGRLPLLRELAQVVAFSPSLSAAVDNQYVQPMEQEQSINGVTAQVEYIIVDQKQLNIFYTLDSPKYQALNANVTIDGRNGESLEGYGISFGGWGVKNGELHHCTVDFMDADMPAGIDLKLAIYDYGSWDQPENLVATQSVEEEMFSDVASSEDDGEFLGEVVFALDFDPAYTAQGEVVNVAQTVTIDEQQLTLTTAEIYPTHIRINFADEPDNTAWLQQLAFYLEDEHGNKFSAIGNGISATGSPDSPMMVSHRLESSYFADSEHLTLHITQVRWLDKDMARVRLDLANVTAERLPQGVRFAQAEKRPEGWLLTFWAKEYEPNHYYSLWRGEYYDEAGIAYDIHQESTSSSRPTDDEVMAGYFCTMIPLQNYTEDSVYLCPNFSRVVEVEPDISIIIK